MPFAYVSRGGSAEAANCDLNEMLKVVNQQVRTGTSPFSKAQSSR